MELPHDVQPDGAAELLFLTTDDQRLFATSQFVTDHIFNDERNLVLRNVTYAAAEGGCFTLVDQTSHPTPQCPMPDPAWMVCVKRADGVGARTFHDYLRELLAPAWADTPDVLRLRLTLLEPYDERREVTVADGGTDTYLHATHSPRRGARALPVELPAVPRQGGGAPQRRVRAGRDHGPGGVHQGRGGRVPGHGRRSGHGGGGVRDFRYNLVIGEEVQAAAVNAAGVSGAGRPGPCTLKPALRTSHSRARQRPYARHQRARFVAPTNMPLTQTGFAAGAADHRLRSDRTSPAQYGIPERVVSCQGL
jgi:hypothetical protein